jgi:hypothetical protein
MVNNEARSRNHLFRGKAICIEYYKCVSVSLPYLSGMQITSYLRSIILSSVARQGLQYFPTIFHKRHDFVENLIKH